MMTIVCVCICFSVCLSVSFSLSFSTTFRLSSRRWRRSPAGRPLSTVVVVVVAARRLLCIVAHRRPARPVAFSLPCPEILALFPLATPPLPSSEHFSIDRRRYSHRVGFDRTFRLFPVLRRKKNININKRFFVFLFLFFFFDDFFANGSYVNLHKNVRPYS